MFEISPLLSPLIVSFAFIAALGLTVMVFSIVFAQMMYGLFDE